MGYSIRMSLSRHQSLIRRAELRYVGASCSEPGDQRRRHGRWHAGQWNRMSYEPLFDCTQRHSGIRTRSTIAGGIRARRSRTRRRTSPPAPGKAMFVADENGQRLAVGEIEVLHPRPAQPHHETLDSFATVLLEGAQSTWAWRPGGVSKRTVAFSLARARTGCMNSLRMLRPPR